MVDKLDWKWRLGTTLGVVCGGGATVIAMAFIVFWGVIGLCGFDELAYEVGSPRDAVCSSGTSAVVVWSALGVAVLGIIGTGIAWISRGRGGKLFVLSLVGGIAVALAIPLTYSAFPAS
jgi:hypothetical protein